MVLVIEALPSKQFRHANAVILIQVGTRFATLLGVQLCVLRRLLSLIILVGSGIVQHLINNVVLKTTSAASSYTAAPVPMAKPVRAVAAFKQGIWLITNRKPIKGMLPRKDEYSWQADKLHQMILSGDFPITFFSESPYQRSFAASSNGTVGAVGICLDANGSWVKRAEMIVAG